MSDQEKPKLDFRELHLQASMIRAKAQLLQAKIQVLEVEADALDSESEALGWELMSWDKLEVELRKHPHCRDYQKMPTVMRYNNFTHCHINDDGKLVVGAYYHNDQFPRGGDLMVRYPWNQWGSPD